MKNLVLKHVVAFNADEKAITCDPSDWRPTLDFSKMRLHLKNKKESRTYDLATDTLCAYPISARQENDIGKTAGRMLLSGVAAGALVKGKVGGGALMDLAIRGSEKRGIAGIRLVMLDTTTMEFESTIDEFTAIIAKLRDVLPDLGDESDHAQIIKTVDSLVADGERVLVELADSIASLSEKYSEAKQNAESGKLFAERNNQRNLIQNLALKLRKKEGIKKAVEFRFAWQNRPPEKFKWKKLIPDLSSIFGAIVLIVLLVAAFKSCTTKPEVSDAKSRNKQSLASASSKREDMQLSKALTTNIEKNSENSQASKPDEPPVHENSLIEGIKPSNNSTHAETEVKISDSAFKTGELCYQNEQTVFSCRTKKNVVSLCDASNASSKGLNYRFGQIDGQPDLVYPAANASRAFKFQLPQSGDLTPSINVAFDRGTHRYTVFDVRTADGQQRQGVSVEDKGVKVADIRCVDKPSTEFNLAVLQKLSNQ